MEERLEWFVEPKVKDNHLIFQDDINNHSLNIEFDWIGSMISSRYVYPPLSSHSHDPLSLDPLLQPLLNSLDFQLVNPDRDWVQGSQL